MKCELCQLDKKIYAKNICQTCYKRTWRRKNSEKCNSAQRQSYWNNLEKNRTENKYKRAKYRRDSIRSEHIRAKNRIYDKSLKRKEWRKLYNKTRKLTLDQRLRKNLRNRLIRAVKHQARRGSAVRDLGCSILEFKKYIESKFQPGMTWGTWGRAGWHLDHIKPLSSFNLTDREQFLEACHYTNLQPLWASENVRKSDKLS